ncbi:MAG: PadR family transcriptional regulator [Anaerolineae bacterium]|nr:PadR family transcriptional regulator [Anaerolineae bacterium]
MAKDNVLSPQSALLGFLTFGPKHPYELHQEFTHQLGNVWHIGQSHLYAHLKQLAEAGLVTVSIEAQPNRPDRTVYHITASGQAQFDDWLRQPTVHMRYFRFEFLTRLYFFRRLEIPGLEPLITAQKALIESRIESLHQAIAQTDDEYWRLVLDFRRSEMQAIVDWLERCPVTSGA